MYYKLFPNICTIMHGPHKHVFNFHNHDTQVAKFLPNTYGDRFIPRRYVCDNTNQRDFRFRRSTRTSSIDLFEMKTMPGYWRMDGLKDSLLACLDDADKKKILEFHEWLTKAVCSETLYGNPMLRTYRERYSNVHGLDWPCVPRIRPSAFADSTHDLPGFNRFSHLNIIAWSKLGKIAASFGMDLVLWMPHSESTVVYRLEGINALMFNGDGKLLAVGIKKCLLFELQIWNVVEKGIYVVEYHSYSPISSCALRCIEWDTKDQFILCGMSNGDIFIHKYPSLAVITSLHVHRDCISDLKFSINGKYFASCDVSGNTFIWMWSNFKPVINCNDTSECMVAWHPWQEEDIVVATTIPAKIRLISMTTKSVVSFYRRTDKKCRIDALTFSKLSGELVVSFSIIGSDQDGITNEILVMSSMSRVVDTLSVHEKGVFFLMWNPDGMQLATAGDDETLNIWNFFSYTGKSVGKGVAAAKKDAKNEQLLKYKKFSAIDSLVRLR